jgi:hypothetical protein
MEGWINAPGRGSFILHLAIGHLSNRLKETIAAGACVESFTLHLLASAYHKSKLSITAILLENLGFQKLSLFESFMQ